MSEGKGTDDLGVFDELLKGSSPEGAAPADTSAAWKGGTLPPPPVQLGGLMAPVGRVSGRPVPPSGRASATPPPPPGRASTVPHSASSMRAMPSPPQMAPPTPPPSRVSAPPPFPPPPRNSAAPVVPPPPASLAHLSSPSSRSNGSSASASAEDNPFLAPLEEGGPASLLPPSGSVRPSAPAPAPLAPVSSRSRPPAPPTLGRPSAPPPSMRSVPRAAPPPQRSSMSPLAVSGTVPPSRSSKASDADIAAFKRRATGGKGPYIAVGLTAVIAVTWVGRDKLTSFAAGTSSKEEAVSVLKATSKQTGIKLVVDGKDIGTLPQELKGLTPGEHTVLFEGGDRYASQKSTVVVGPNETKELDPVSLKVTKGAATFDVKTAGATLALVASDERRALTDYSRPIDVDTSKSWTLEASKTGYKTLRVPVTFDDQAAKTFPVSLDSEKSGGIDISALPADNGGNDTAAAKPGKGGRVVATAKKTHPIPDPESGRSLGRLHAQLQLHSRIARRARWQAARHDTEGRHRCQRRSTQRALRRRREQEVDLGHLQSGRNQDGRGSHSSQ